MQNKTNNKDYCNNCDRYINQKEVNGAFVCEYCEKDNIATYYTAEELLNETETEPFTIEERTDLNINKVTHDKVKRVGTDFFTYKEMCLYCDTLQMVNINGYCKKCLKRANK
jgi:hypothetical protein